MLSCECAVGFGSVLRVGLMVDWQGFGNMSGGMDFWDRNKLKIIGSTKVNPLKLVGGFGCFLDTRNGS